MEKVNRAGEKYIINGGYRIEVIEYFGAFNCTIKFENGVIIKAIKFGDIVRKSIKNPYHKSVQGVGYFGIGKYSQKTHPKAHKTWTDMLRRCYDDKYQERQPTYIGCSVAEEWHNFQVFGEWFEENYIDGFALDKDLFIKRNKIYSPKTCCFISSEINNLLAKANSIRGNYPIGVCKVGNKFQASITINSKRVFLGYFTTPEQAFQAYKFTKEKHIKEIADKWKDKISEPTYQALMNYTVEITD